MPLPRFLMPVGYWLLLAGAALLGVYIACPRPAGPPSEEALAAAIYWQALTCSVDGDRAVEEILVRHKAELEPFFLDALARGPAPDLIREVEAAADEQYRRQRVLFDSGESFGLKAADLKIAHADKREEYVSRQRTAFINRYKSQAVAALGLLGGRRGRRQLEALARDRNSPLQSSAGAALGDEKSSQEKSSKRSVE